jgi:hypothetical protein
VLRIVEALIPSGQIKQIKQSYMGCVEMLLLGTPFDTDGSMLVETQLQFLELITEIWRIGYKMIGSVHTALGVYDRVKI